MKVKIGVDGGATKTECILVNETGAVLARHLAKGCSPSHLGPAKAAQVVRDALHALLEKGGPRPPGEGKATSPAKRPSPGGRGPSSEATPTVAATLLCLTGNREFWREFGRTLSGFGQVLTLDDSYPILELATAGQPGLVLHGGTGSFVAARVLPVTRDIADGVAYAGGLGWRFGDPGSGYDLGRRAIARALLELQGWMSPSGIGPLVCAHTGLTDAGAISRHYYQGWPSACEGSPSTSEGGPRPPGEGKATSPAKHPSPGGRGPPSLEADIASLAPGILRLAAERDAAAHSLVVESVAGLLDLAVRAATKLFPNRSLRSLRAGLSGPILNDPTVVKILSDRSPIPLEQINEPPIEGVRRMLELW